MIPLRSFIIYSFHMPLYFALSGYLFSQRSTLKQFVKAKFDRMLIPYFFFSFLSFCVYICQHLFTGDVDLIDAGKSLGKIVAGLPIPINLSLWFLTCLFCTSVIYKLLDSYIERKSIVDGIVFLFSIGGYIMSIYVPPLYVPFKLDVSFSAIVFFHFGFVVKKRNWLEKNLNFMIIGLCVVLWLSFGWLNREYLLKQGINNSNMSINCLGQYFFFYISAFSGIVSFMRFSNYVHWPVVVWLGKNSLVLMAVHFPFLFMQKYFLAYIPNDIVAKLVMAVVLTLMCVPFCFVFKRFCPTLSGYK